MNSQERDTLAALAREVKDTWPTVDEIAEEYGFSASYIRRLVSDGDVRAFRLGHIHVDPDSFAAWLARRQRR